jgi:hypothetical protein
LEKVLFDNVGEQIEQAVAIGGRVFGKGVSRETRKRCRWRNKEDVSLAWLH